MIKYLYTKIGDTYYKVRRNMCIEPRVTLRESAINPLYTQYIRPDFMSHGVYKIQIDTTANDTVTTNDILYETMINELRANAVTKIDELSDAYRVMIEYDILDEHEKSIDHSITLHDVIDSDVFTMVTTLSDTNTIKCRFNKRLKSVDHIPIKVNTPLSVMHENKVLYLKIKDISVYQYPPYDMNQTHPDHVSLYAREMYFGTPLLNTMLSDMTKIYSTKDSNIDIMPVDITPNTQKLYIDIGLVLDKFISVMDETLINEILTFNLNELENTNNDDISDTPTNNAEDNSGNTNEP